MTSKLLLSYFFIHLFQQCLSMGKKPRKQICREQRESRLFLASFLGGNLGVLVPVIEYLFVGFVVYNQWLCSP